MVISSHICEDNLVIVVEDNGRGITSERMAVLRRLLASEELFEQGDGENVGLINVVQRLRFYYGESAGVMLTDCEPQGLKVTLHIPAPTIGEEL